MKKLITAVALLAIALVCGAWSFGNVRIGQFRKALPYSSGTLYATNTWVTNITTFGDLANSHNGRIGCQIVPKENIYVTAIGRWKLAGNSQVHQLNIVDIENTNIVVSGSVDLSSGDAGFVYFTLTNECILYAGRSYALWSYETSGGDYWYDSATVLENTDVAYSSNALYALGGAYEPYGFVSGSNHCYGPVNFKYANVPIAPWKNPSLVLFAEAESVAGSVGTLVSTLPDQSANGYSLTNPSTATQVILSNNAAVFNGKKFVIFPSTVDRFLKNETLTVSQPDSIFLVARFNSIISVPFVFDGAFSANRQVAYHNSGLLQSAGTDTLMGQPAMTQPVLWEFQFNGAASKCYTNGVLMGSGDVGANSLQGLMLGMRYSESLGMHMDVAALGIYGNLSDDSRAAIRNYYRTNYNLW